MIWVNSQFVVEQTLASVIYRQSVITLVIESVRLIEALLAKVMRKCKNILYNASSWLDLTPFSKTSLSRCTHCKCALSNHRCFASSSYTRHWWSAPAYRMTQNRLNIRNFCVIQFLSLVGDDFDSRPLLEVVLIAKTLTLPILAICLTFPYTMPTKTLSSGKRHVNDSYLLKWFPECYHFSTAFFQHM